MTIDEPVDLRTYRANRYTYILFLFKRSHHCLFHPSRFRQEAKIKGRGGQQMSPEFPNKPMRST